MKRVEINELQFKRLIDGVKHCVSKDASRPILQYIQIIVKHDTITAYALDGYRAGRVEIKNTCPIDEEFTCYIKPLAIKVSKSAEIPVVIELTDGKTFIEAATEYGIIKYGFTVPQDKFIDVEKIFANNRPHDRDLGLQPKYVIEALKAVNGVGHCYDCYYAVLESKKNNTQPFIIRAKNDDVINEQLILPVKF